MSSPNETRHPPSQDSHTGATDPDSGKIAWVSLVGARQFQAYYLDHGGLKQPIAGTVTVPLN